MGKSSVEGSRERFRLEWPGKRAAMAMVNQPATHWLYPVREESVNFDTPKTAT